MAGTRRTRNKVTIVATTTTVTTKVTKAAAAKAKKRDTKAEAKKKAVDDAKKASTPAKVDKEEEKEAIVERQTAISNGVMVDHKVPNPAAHEVVKFDGKVLNCNMMFADCGNNNNKFYIVQGLKSGGSYFLWTRWGRVGVDGQSARQPCAGEQGLVRTFNSKVNQKRSKGYTEIEITYEDVEETAKKLEKQEKKKNKKPKKDSQLDKPVQDLLRFIFDMKQIEQSVVKVGFNVKKLPLGKLSKNTILKGYSVLKDIEKALQDNKGKPELGRLSSEFYRHIPHDFKFQHMSNFIIDSKEKLKEKLELVQTLGDIQIAAEIANKVDDLDDDLNELDAKYKMMKCSIESMDKNSKEFKDLLKTVDTTHGSTHHFKIKVEEIFKINREGEEARFNKKVGNRKLLWHGSRFSNWGGILSQGLRIAPPEAPVSGYMFGKGVYFADIVTKSAGYCCSYLSNNEGLLALCEVALGEPRELLNADYNASNLPKGKSSTKGCGKWVPTKEIEIDGINAYIGPIDDLGNKYSLRYNEFISYDVANIQIKYLFRCKMN